MPADPFTTLGLRPTFDLSPDEIRAAWLKHSLSAHPDRAAEDSVASRDITASLNHAKQLLENPESRANALLDLLGGPTKEEDKALPDGFLIEIMQLREDLESAQQSENTAALDTCRIAALQRRDTHIEFVRTLFASEKQPTEPTRRAIRVELNAWRYIERMLEQLDPVST